MITLGLVVGIVAGQMIGTGIAFVGIAIFDDYPLMANIGFPLIVLGLLLLLCFLYAII